MLSSVSGTVLYHLFSFDVQRMKLRRPAPFSEIHFENHFQYRLEKGGGQPFLSESGCGLLAAWRLDSPHRAKEFR